MKRNLFSLSHGRVHTGDMGELLPVGAVDTLAGDGFQHATSLFFRWNPLVFPPLHAVHARITHWFVPYRLIWDDWEKFITGGPDGLDASVYPTVSLTGATDNAVGTLSDHLGFPAGQNIVGSALYHRAYALIWNEKYRDPDLQTALVMSKASGPDTTTSRTLQLCNWEKDYFTKARPWTQKGAAVTMPLGTTAPIKGLGVLSGTPFTTTTGTIKTTGGIDINPTAGAPWHSSAANAIYYKRDDAATTYPKIEADLAGASSATVNALRQAFAIQKYQEARARYGSRYTELLRYYGIRPADSRLDKPELLGSGEEIMSFSEVLQTAPTTSGSTTGVGNMKGHGIGLLRSNRYRRQFDEHGIVLSLLHVRPRSLYTQGIPKKFIKTTKYDFWTKELEHIGMQEIQNRELYAQHATPTGVFGYVPRYEEYRSEPSTVHGQARTLYDNVHMGRIFSSDPALNSTFVQANVSKRNFADTTNDGMIIGVKHSIQARRLVAREGTPI